MRISKNSSSVEPRDAKSMLKSLDNDVRKIFQLTQGRIRFGSGVDGERAENISGVFQQFASHATPNTEFSVAHGCGTIPIGFQIMWQDKAGDLFQGPSTGTAWTDVLAYFKCSVASVTFNGLFHK